MKVYSILKIGEFHQNFCEDFVFHQSISKDWTICAVFDGCSSGKESYFASALLGKILKKICKTLPYLELQNPILNLEKVDIKILAKEILKLFFEEIKKVQNILFLDVIELVSTAIISIYHMPKRRVWINISGDGVIALNGEIIEVNQNDKPNYLIYHLNEPFEKWFKNHTKTFTSDEIIDLAISTDGILSFAKNSTEDSSEINPIKYLLLNTEFLNQENMFERKCRVLNSDFQLKPNDDLGIIRIVV